MMRPTTFTVNASGAIGGPAVLDYYVAGYAIAVTQPLTGAIYTLQYSLDDPFQNWSVSMNTSATWFNWDDALLVNASTNRATNLAFAPRAIRLASVSGLVSANNPITVTVVPLGAIE